MSIGNVDQILQQRMDRLTTAFRRDWMTYIMLVPVLTIMGVLVWGSLLDGIVMSFYSYNFLGQREWAGLENYAYLLQWRVFWASMKATIVFSIVTFTQLAVAIVAVLSVRQARFRNIISTLFVIPYTIPGLVSGTMWVYILHPTLGPVFTWLQSWGVINETIYWGSNGDTAMGVIMFAATWAYWPLVFILLNAAIGGIPKSHYETAEVYGASRLQTLWHITLPQLKGTILIAVSLRTIYNLTKVSQPLQITGGGPGYETSILGILVYRFTAASQQYGLAMAAGVVLVVLTMLFVVPYIRSFEKDDVGGEIA